MTDATPSEIPLDRPNHANLLLIIKALRTGATGNLIQSLLQLQQTADLLVAQSRQDLQDEVFAQQLLFLRDLFEYRLLFLRTAPDNTMEAKYRDVLESFTILADGDPELLDIAKAVQRNVTMEASVSFTREAAVSMLKKICETLTLQMAIIAQQNTNAGTAVLPH